MIKNLLLAAALLLALPTWASTTWTAPDRRTSVATCTTGTEGAPTGTVGIPLDNVSGFTVHVEAGGAMTADGTFQAYIRNRQTGNWNRAPDLDLVAKALSRQAFTGFSVVAGADRLAYVPNGIGVAVTIYINGAYPFH